MLLRAGFAEKPFLAKLRSHTLKIGKPKSTAPRQETLHIHFLLC